MDFLIDIRQAARSLLRRPGATAAVVATLGLGIGLAATVFVAADALVFRPLPYPDADRVFAMTSTNASQRVTDGPLSYPDFHDIRAAARTLEAAAAYIWWQSYNLSDADAAPERVRAGRVSASLFPLLGVTPALGRPFHEDDDVPGAERVTILGDGLWRRRYGARPDIVGRQIQLNGFTFTVVGVMPPGFSFPQDQQIWTTLRFSPTDERGARNLNAVVRLRPGVSAARAQQELDAICRGLEERFPDADANWRVALRSVREAETGRARATALILLASVGLVLLIACANVANLQLSSAVERLQQMAVRSALGSGRWRLVRLQLTESVMLAALGGAVGLVASLWGKALLEAALPSQGLPHWARLSLDWRASLFAAAVSLAMGALFGLAPAIVASQTDVTEQLKAGGRTGPGRARRRFQDGLVVAEVGLSLVLAAGAGLLLRSLASIDRVDPGFQRAGVLTARVSLSGERFGSEQAVTAFYRDVIQRIAERPGVASAAAVDMVPVADCCATYQLRVEGRPYDPDEPVTADVRVVFGDPVGAMGMRLERGRSIEARDVEAGSNAVVVNSTMAASVWPGEDALGKRFRLGSDTTRPWYTVVGVVRDPAVRRVWARPENQTFVPFNGQERSAMALVVRAAGSTTPALSVVREAVREIAPDLPVYGAATMEEVLRSAAWDRRLVGRLFGAFALVSLALAALGLYAVVARAASGRTREIGIRMALGAGRSAVLRGVLRHGAVLGGLGIALGVGGALALTRVLRSLLFGVSPTDVPVLAGVAALLGSIALLASWLPAWRASRIDPAAALRYE